MHAALGFQISVRVIAAHHERRALDARFIAAGVIDHLRRPAATLAVAQVHAQQHLRPILRLGAAGARVNGDDRIAIIVLAGELHRQLDRVDLLLELADERFDIGIDVLAFFLKIE